MKSLVFTCALLAIPGLALCAEPESSIYYERVKAYADTMIEHGRDKYGEVHTPLFAGALDRSSLKISPDFPDIPGIRAKDRCLTGANPMIEKGLYHLLYELTEITNDKKYAEEADKSLQFFFQQCQNKKNGFLPWGEHLLWDFNTETYRASATNPREARKFYHEPTAWPFRDEVTRVAPEAYYRYAMALWKYQVGDKETGDFSRHANYKGGGGRGAAFPRLAGQMIEIWADAYARPEFKDKEERDILLHAIEKITRRMVTNRDAVGDARILPFANPYSLRGGIKKGRTYPPAPEAWFDSNLELARGLLSGADLVPPELGKLMKEVALTQHKDFLRQPHYHNGEEMIWKVSTGMGESKKDRKAKKGKADEENLWFSAYGSGGGFTGGNTRKMATAYVTMKDNYPEQAERYKALLIQDCQKYLESAPDLAKAKEVNLKPSVYATLIELMLMMKEITGEQEYLTRAEFFAQQSVALFLGGVEGPGAALPKSSSQTDHYESITGGPTLMHQLLQVHLALQ